ncbi:MAG: stress-induced acidophilic repeat motif-containing protein [Acidobacteria bacterium]|nr:stress-induced acidophilic repeat motif-containing protein [Acidobacteriota bacterium]
MANTSKRGFASMDAAKQREIASKGGRAAHAKGTAHEFTSDEARVAGRKGGEAVSRDRVHMSTIGREGGHSRGARARAAVGSENAGTSSTPESFERQVTSERSAFEPSGRGIDRASDRGNYSSQDSGSNAGSNTSRSTNERNDYDASRNDRGSYGGRGQI